MRKPFLTAEWQKLVMANYAIDEKVLSPYLPFKTEIDKWNNTCYVSLIGFMFTNTALKGIKIPFHTHFEEVNLRFYVRYHENGVWKRGVVFIKEIVPKLALTLVANTLYKEHYTTLPMRHEWIKEENRWEVEYAWKQGQWHRLKIITDAEAKPIELASEEEFITEHYWGYTKISDTKTSEYQVAHPRWNVYTTLSYEIEVNFAQVYGADFAFLNQCTPHSVFMAEGSAIQVMHGRTL